MCRGLSPPFYQDQSRPNNYPRWYKRSTIKEKISRNFQRHRELSVETEIRHFSGFGFKSNNRKWSVPLKGVGSKSAFKFYVSRKITALLIMRIMRYLNGSKLHLNLKDNKVLTEKFTEAVWNISHWLSLLHSLRKARDDSGLHNCHEYKATSKLSLMNMKSLKDIRKKNLGKIVIAHLIINSIRQKFDSLIEFTTGSIDMLRVLLTYFTLRVQTFIIRVTLSHQKYWHIKSA